MARNFEENGYPDLGDLQPALLQDGNKAAADYPNLDRILKAEIVELE